MKYILIIFLLYQTTFALDIDPLNKIPRLVDDANKAYESGNYDEALQKYTAAQTEDPLNPEIQYNIGNTLYQMKNYDKALELYKKAAENGNADDAARIHYNIGNTLYRMGEQNQEKMMDLWKQSIDSYKESLKIKPDDTDAKFNIEFVRKKIKEMAQQNQEQQKDQQQQQQQNQNQEQQKEQQQQQQNQNQEQQKDQQDQQQQNKEEEKKDNQEQQKNEENKADQNQEQKEKKSMPADQKIDKDDAERILDSLNEDEKEKLKEQLQKQGYGSGDTFYDW